MARELYVNDFPTALQDPITTVGETTIVVEDGTTYPKTGNFRVIIETEILIVTAVAPISGAYAPATWTVTRGAEGTTAATHTAGTRIDAIVTAGALDRFKDCVSTSVISDYNANLTPRIGDFFIPSNSFYTMVVYTQNGWRFLMNGRIMNPPSFDNTFIGTASPDFTESVDTSLKTLIMYNPTPAYSIHMRYRVAPDPPYTCTAAFIPHYFFAGFVNCGLGWMDETFKAHITGIGIASSPTRIFRSYYWNNLSTYSGNVTYVDAPAMCYHGPVVWMQLTDDGVNRAWKVSSNGLTWSQVGTVSRTTFLTPYYIGIQHSDDTANPHGMTVLHWEIT